DRERTVFQPPLSSICFPLFGTGHGRLSVPVCAAALWRGIAEELAAAPHWSVHLATHNPGHAAQVLKTLEFSLYAPSRSPRCGRTDPTSSRTALAALGESATGASGRRSSRCARRATRRGSRRRRPWGRRRGC